MRRHRRLLACSILFATSLIGIGCTPHQPAPDLSDRPSVVAGVDYMNRFEISEDMFQAPPGQIRVFTTTRPALEAARSGGDGSDFDNSARPLFYMGSEADWDYYYLADHAFGLFWRVRREFNRQDERMPLTGDSLGWREVKATATTSTRKS